MLDVAQVLAWARMFAEYARMESVVSAAKDTFDPGRSCAICRAVSRARQAQGQHAPVLAPSGPDKVILILENPARFIALDSGRGWPEWTPAAELARDADVPVPPPRAALA
jgi:hypothetical protein